MNMVATLCAYAALCRDQGLPFVFPGSETQWSSLTDVTDADLLAEQMTWAARTPAGVEPAFKRRRQHLPGGAGCRPVADWFGLDWEGWSDAGPRPLEVADGRGSIEGAWRDLAARHDLVEPDLARVASWWHTDADLGRDIEVVADGAEQEPRRRVHRPPIDARLLPRVVRPARGGPGRAHAPVARSSPEWRCPAAGQVRCDARKRDISE